MKVTVSEPEAGKKQFEVEVPAERVQLALKRAYADYQKKVNLPGFRKGKVPIDIIKGRYGPAIEAEVIDAIVTETYRDAQKEHDVKPAGAAQIEDIDYDHGKPLKYKAVVEIMPEVSVKEYVGLTIEKVRPRVTEADVDMTLESLREQYAEVTSVDSEAREGHFVVADIQGVDRSGLPIIGDKLENIDLQLGKSSFGPEFDKELVGMKRDQERIIKVVYPRDHPDSKLAGSERSFLVKVKEIKKVILPELDDELAETVADLKTLEDLRQEVRKDLVRRAERNAEFDVRNQIADRLTKGNPIPVPDSMVNRFLDLFIDDVKTKSKEPLDEELWRNRYRPYAVNQIRLHLLFEEIKRLERIEGDDEEVMDYLVSVAKITEVEPTVKEGYPSLIVE